MNAPRPKPLQAPNQVRIIGGQFKRSVLPVVSGVDGLRPSLARVRQTLFDWLGHDLTGWWVLDAFAGTGSLGFEAASRGAASVLMVDAHPTVVAHLDTVKTKLNASAVTVRRGDGLAALQAQVPGSLALVLLDPPFGVSASPAQLSPLLVAAVRALVPGGLVYLEADAKAPVPDLTSLSLALHRQGRAGAVAFRLFVKASATPA